jgi:hypothetical protein
MLRNSAAADQLREDESHDETIVPIVFLEVVDYRTEWILKLVVQIAVFWFPEFMVLEMHEQCEKTRKRNRM